MTIEDVIDLNNLYNSALRCYRNCSWKESVQRFKINFLKNIYELRKSVIDGTYTMNDFYEFILNERGRERYVKALSIEDRVLVDSLNHNVILPTVEKYLIYDNGSSLKNKGTEFSRNRLYKHLRQYYINNGNSNEGYVLKIDFTKYYDNIQHKKLNNMMSDIIDDEDILRLYEAYIDSFKIDISFIKNKKYNHIKESDFYNKIFDSLKYHKNIDKNSFNKNLKLYAYMSLGIGSPLSQTSGLLYPTEIDNYCKIVNGCKYYGRVMDDIYIIDSSKEYLLDLLKGIKEIADSLGIQLNKKKTKIIKLTKGFTFLQITYRLNETGKIITTIPKQKIIREKRKLKRLKFLFDEGKVTYEDINHSYNSWKGSAIKFDSTKRIKYLDDLYNNLFIKPFITQYNYNS